MTAIAALAGVCRPAAQCPQASRGKATPVLLPKHSHLTIMPAAQWPGSGHAYLAGGRSGRREASITLGAKAHRQAGFRALFT